MKKPANNLKKTSFGALYPVLDNYQKSIKNLFSIIKPKPEPKLVKK